METIKSHYFGVANSPLFGLFGDHWQKIYGNGCGEVVHLALKGIGKEANFRSVPAIVDCLNRMRPSLPQFVVDPEAEGEVSVFHTNDWNGDRQKGAHYGGDLPPDVANSALLAVREKLAQAGWNLGPRTRRYACSLIEVWQRSRDMTIF